MALDCLGFMPFGRWLCSFMETLRLLANCDKHNPSEEPEEQLLKHLALDESVPYAPLAESNSLREALAASDRTHAVTIGLRRGIIDLQ
jgi:hypothetical protein